MRRCPSPRRTTARRSPRRGSSIARELGDIAATGIFTAAGNTVGEGTVTARFGAREGTAKIKIVLTQKQNGAPAGVDAGARGFGGIGGVGGEPLGPAVAASDVTKLETMGTAPANAAELGFLYPYDGTVWPRGLLPPLLMWQSTHDANAVWVKLTQGNYTYEGTFSYSAQPAGSDARKRIRIEDDAWKTATQGNQGDPLIVQVKILASDGTVYGPITQSWKVASGVLKGTVYYNSYDSLITTNGGVPTGGVIAIKPRSPDPALAVASEAGKCHVCHTLSADGSTLWAQDGDDYANGASYDLTKGGARTSYITNGVGGIAANNRKFVWSAPYPDGSFALASSRFAREAYTQTDSEAVRARRRQRGAFDGPRDRRDERGHAGVRARRSQGGLQLLGGHRRRRRRRRRRSLARGVRLHVRRRRGLDDVPGRRRRAFSGLREIYKDPARYPSWPTFLPDGKAVVFNNQVMPRHVQHASPPDRARLYNCQITTWFSAKAALWIAKDAATNDARALVNANGVGLPTNADHPDDTQLNYQPTVNPVPSGGYYWVVFTSRRIYGNLLTGPPWGAAGDGGTSAEEALGRGHRHQRDRRGRSQSPGVLLARPGARRRQLARLLGRRPVQGQRQLLRVRRRVLQRLLPEGPRRRCAGVSGQAAGDDVRAGIREVHGRRRLLRSHAEVHRRQVRPAGAGRQMSREIAAKSPNGRDRRLNGHRAWNGRTSSCVEPPMRRDRSAASSVRRTSPLGAELAFARGGDRLRCVRLRGPLSAVRRRSAPRHPRRDQRAVRGRRRGVLAERADGRARVRHGAPPRGDPRGRLDHHPRGDPHASRRRRVHLRVLLRRVLRRRHRRACTGFRSPSSPGPATRTSWPRRTRRPITRRAPAASGSRWSASSGSPERASSMRRRWTGRRRR